MNRSQLRDAVYDRLGVDSSDPRNAAGRIDRLINEALHWIAVDHDWPWLSAKATFSTVAGTDSYAPPADWLRTRSLRVANRTAMQVYSSDELDDYWPDAALTGEPVGFAIEADQIVLRPVPAGVYVVTHRYVKQEPDLANDDASPLMPSSFHSAIAEIAAYLSLRRTREEQRSGVAMAAYKDWREQMLSYEERTRNSPHVRIRDGAWL